MTEARIYYKNSQPILRVENMEASVRFYVGALGFSNALWRTDEFMSVNRDRAGIYLSRGGQGRGAAWVWLRVDDVEIIHQDLQRRGVPVRMAPRNYPCDLEMQVEDPDGMCCALGATPSLSSAKVLTYRQLLA